MDPRKTASRRNNRCNICKERRVKCDEAWPMCTPCRKGDRPCPGPPKQEFTFVEVDNPIQSFGATPSNSGQNDRKGGGGTQMITLHTKRYQNGAQTRKIRLLNHVGDSKIETAPGPTHIESVPQPPMSSPSDVLGRRLSWLCQSSQHPRLQGNAKFFGKLLDRIGTQKALDTTLECLVSGHEALGRDEPACNWLNTRLYSKAIVSVQEAIDNIRTRYTTETLAAVDVLWRTEGFFGRTKTVDGIAVDDRTMVRDQMFHGKAMAQILNYRGLTSIADTLERYLVTDCMVGEVQVALMSSRPSIFDTLKWETILSSLEIHDVLEELYIQVTSVFIKWPGLIKDLSTYLTDPSMCGLSIDRIFQKAIHMAEDLESVAFLLENMVTSHLSIIPTPEHFPCAPSSYHFHDRKALPTLTNYVFLKMITHRAILLMFLLLINQSSATVGAWEPEYLDCNGPFDISTSRDQLKVTARRIWSMYNQIRSWKPGGSGFFGSALKISYLAAETIEEQVWVVDAINDIEDFLPEERKWTTSRLAVWCDFATGAIPLSELLKHW